MIDRMHMLFLLFLLGVIIFISHRYLVEKERREHYENFQDERKGENLCLKPFSVTNNKESTFRALIALEERIDELEYNIRKSGQRYEPMYKWYKFKTDKDSKEAKEATDALKKQMGSAIKAQIRDVEQEYLKEQQAPKLNAVLPPASTPAATAVKDTMSAAFEGASDESDRDDLIDAADNLDIPDAYW